MSIERDVRRGLAWSTVNSLALRVGSVITGMVLARLLAPEDFGVYAIALTVQSVLVTLADLGMSIDLVRAEDPERRAPTVTTLSVLSGIVLALLMVATAGPFAQVMGAPEAADVISVLAVTLIISSIGVVPYARLQREFRQKQLFATSGADLVTSTAVTVGLILLGMGPMALALGRVAAQTVATSLQFVLARCRLRFGFDRRIARSALAFGLPLAAANLLSWALLNVDKVAIGRISGTAALGLYVLAFNISSWPMSAIGQAIRSVSLAGFSRANREGAGDGLPRAMSLSWGVALPVGVLLAALAHPLIVVMYGERWTPGAAALAALGMFGAMRVALDMVATYLMAKGAARGVLYVQIAWFAALIPVTVLATRWYGVAGAGWAHLIVAVAVVAPGYAVAVARVGGDPKALGKAMLVPIAAAVPMWFAAHLLAGAIQQPFLALVAGGAAGVAVYAALCWRWSRKLLATRTAEAGPVKAVAQPRLEAV